MLLRVCRRLIARVGLAYSPSLMMRPSASPNREMCIRQGGPLLRRPVVCVPLNIADRKAVSEGAAPPVATSEVVKPELERIVVVTTIVTRKGRITEASQQCNYHCALAHLSSR